MRLLACTFAYVFGLFLSALPAEGAGCENYCVGIRGNGEAAPAHWSALSRMVEENGMPRATAGGSSATVTMFFVDSMGNNEKLKAEQNAEKKRKMQALMLKSMPEFMAVMSKDAKIADGFAMAQAYAGGDPELRRKAIEAFGKAGTLSPAELQATFAKYGNLLNPELVQMVKSNPARFGPEAVKSIKNLGAFNAVTDDTLFFRPGIMDFKMMAVALGHAADFYAGNTDPATKEKFEAFLEECSEKAFRKEWADVPESDCRGKFQGIVAEYLKNGQFQNKALFQKVGTNTESLPTTSILQGQGMTDYLKMKQNYLAGKAPNIADFSVNFERDVSFGYWGRQDQLNRVKQGLGNNTGDAKSDRFRALGPANWFEVLGLSPAEPGIANAQRIPYNTSREQVLAEMQKPITERWKGLHYRSDALSLGGWSDLHPTQVLKASGCTPTVFLTRHGAHGDSKFGQQLFIRLTGTKKDIPFWDKIGEGGPSGWCPDKIRAAGGDPEVVARTPWARISNLCNPQSSFRRALDASDATYCTDWDNANLDVFKGQFRPLIREAYQAPMIPNTPAGAACKLNTQPASKDPRGLPGCIPYGSSPPHAAEVTEAGVQSSQ